MPQHQKREKNTRDDALGEIPINFEPRFTRVASEAFMTKLEEYLTQQ